MFLSIKRIKEFDRVTAFRLENAFIFAFIIGLMSPILANLKGLLSVTVLSLIAIFSKLIMKTNDFFDRRYNLLQIYKMGVLLNICFIISTMIYFINPKIMILLDSILSILEFGIYSVYSIKLNYYLTNYDNKMFKEFQKVKNSIWADGSLLGLLTATVLSFIFQIKYIIIISIIVYTAYVIRLLANWNFYKELTHI